MKRAIAREDDCSLMPRAVALFAHFVHVTDSAPHNEEDSQACGFASLAGYRAARENEFRNAFNATGLSDFSHWFWNRHS